MSLLKSSSNYLSSSYFLAKNYISDDMGLKKKFVI